MNFRALLAPKGQTLVQRLATPTDHPTHHPINLLRQVVIMDTINGPILPIATINRIAQRILIKIQLQVSRTNSTSAARTVIGTLQNMTSYRPPQTVNQSLANPTTDCTLEEAKQILITDLQRALTMTPLAVIQQATKLLHFTQALNLYEGGRFLCNPTAADWLGTLIKDFIEAWTNTYINSPKTPPENEFRAVVETLQHIDHKIFSILSPYKEIMLRERHTVTHTDRTHYSISCWHYNQTIFMDPVQSEMNRRFSYIWAQTCKIARAKAIDQTRKEMIRYDNLIRHPRPVITPWSPPNRSREEVILPAIRNVLDTAVFPHIPAAEMPQNSFDDTDDDMSPDDSPYGWAPLEPDPPQPEPEPLSPILHTNRSLRTTRSTFRRPNNI